jgi:hypothetical protein
MPLLTASSMTLLDVARQTEGKEIADVVEILAQQNPIVQDAIAVECNMGTIHRHSIRTGLPSVAWGSLYKGIAQSKSTYQQVDDTTGFVEALSSVDKRLLDLAKNPAKVRLNEAYGFLEAMNQEAATGIFYHNTASTPEKIKGLSARYNVRGGGGAGKNVFHGGASGSDNTSIWFVTWSEMATHLIYPEGTTAGLKREDKGEQRVLDGSSNPYFVKEEMFSWHMGVAVKDWRYNSRVCNIDVSDAIAGSVDLYDLMSQAYFSLQSRRVPNGKQVIYCNRDIMYALDKLSRGTGSASNGKLHLTRKELEGEEVLTFRGMPIRETDALVNSETIVPTA